MSRFFTVVLIAFISMMSFSGFAQEPNVVDPLTMKVRSVDFGRLREGKTVQRKLHYLNTTGENLAIKFRKNPKSVFSAEAQPATIGPNDSGDFSIKLNPGAAPGKYRDSIIAEVRMGKNLVQEIKLSASVIILAGKGGQGPVILFENNTCNLEHVQYGNEYTCTFRFRNMGDEPLLLTSVGVGTDSVTVNYPKTPVLPGQSGTITATFTANGFGALRKFLSVNTNMRENPGPVNLLIKGKFPH